MLEGMSFTEWIEIPIAFLAWRARQGNRPLRADSASGPNNECFLDEYGVYLLSEFSVPPVDRRVVLAEHPIIYVGKAALQTFFERWTNTHRAWEKLGERYKNRAAGISWFFSLARVRRKEITGQVWSEEIRIAVDAIYIEYLEKTIRELLSRKNSYYCTRKIGD
jgi:hypothetical protein